VAALRDELTAFSAPGLPSADEMEAAIRRDIERLSGLQNDDGGFPVWERRRDSIPFHTIHVAHALQRSELMEFEVPKEMRARALDYLQEIEEHYPSWYGKRTRQTLSAYALYVRHLMGDGDVGKARRLLEDAGLEELSLGGQVSGQLQLDSPGGNWSVRGRIGWNGGHVSVGDGSLSATGIELDFPVWRRMGPAAAAAPPLPGRT